MKHLAKFICLAGLVFSAAAMADYSAKCFPPKNGSDGRCEFTNFNDATNIHSFECRVSYKSTTPNKSKVVVTFTKNSFFQVTTGQWGEDNKMIKEITPANISAFNGKRYVIRPTDFTHLMGEITYNFKVLKGETSPDLTAGRDTSVDCTVHSTK